MRRWLCLMTMCGLMACSKKDDATAGGDSASGNAEDSAAEDSGEPPGCTETAGELVVAITVDGTAPSDVDDYRALVRSGDEEALQVTLNADAVAEITLEEGAYSVSATALDGGAGASWIDFVAVLACARTEVTVDMVGIGR